MLLPGFELTTPCIKGKRLGTRVLTWILLGRGGEEYTEAGLVVDGETGLVPMAVTDAFLEQQNPRSRVQDELRRGEDVAGHQLEGDVPLGTLETPLGVDAASQAD